MAAAYQTLLGEGGNRKRLIIAIVVAVVIILLIIILAVVLSKRKKKEDHDGKSRPHPTAMRSKADRYKEAAVATDSSFCSEKGKDMLLKGGNAMDAAIASLFCVGVVNIHSTGIGGGGFLVYYDRKQKKAFTYDSRETAPGKATEDMYLKDLKAARIGGLATGVPGEVMGLYQAWKDHGKLSWSELIEPSVELAIKGQLLPSPVYKAMRHPMSANLKKDPGLRALLLKKDGNMKKLGDLLKNPELGETLKKIQKNPLDFYNGSLAAQIVKDVQNASGIITLDDLKNYRLLQNPPLTSKIGKLDMHLMPLPSGGPVLGMIMNILEGYNFSSDDLKTTKNKVKTYHKIIESLKWAYSKKAILGDPDFLPSNITKIVSLMLNQSFADEIRKNKIWLNQTHEYTYYEPLYGLQDYGTSHLSVLDKDGNAASATHTINYYFGAGYRSPVTGIIYNNEMADFSTKMTYPSNFIRPGKRPLSSMSPVVITDENGDVKMVAGASGGSKITSATAIVIAKKLLMNDELGAAIEDPRFHHKFSKDVDVIYEQKWPLAEDIRKGLEHLGHRLQNSTSKAVVQAIYKNNSTIYAKSDPRKGGKAAGY